MLRRLFIAGFLTVFLSGIVLADPPPSWMRQAASASVPNYEKNVQAVVLHNEQQLSLSSDGKLVTTENRAVKILTREGRREAIADVIYLVSAGKVRELSAWLIRPDGTIKEYDKKSIIDRISDPDDVYDEYRVKYIDGRDDVDVGAVFGYTIISEDRPIFFQDRFFFQDELPTLFSRYSLTLPQGWKASSLTFNHPEIKPQINGTNYSWEVRNLSPIAIEPMSPSFVNLVPRIAVNFMPEKAEQGVNRVFADWIDVSRWATQMYDAQVVVDDSVAAKAQELTANAKTEFDKIRAIGTFVQNLQYISIDIGVGYGNGYRPRPSNLVLNRGYGDCKDKATLMRAMLKALKIEAYPVAIYSGEPNYVRAEWASPSQFNHCIIAVRISDSTQAASVITHPKLGRLLIFDATDPFTSVGDLPDEEQGSQALIMAGENGGLATMPITPPEFNSMKRNVEVTLHANGTIEGIIRERSTGQPSRYERAGFRLRSVSDYNKSIESWLTRGATAARLTKLTPNDRYADASFDLDVEFIAPAYGQLMQNRLLVFKPAIVSRSNSIYLTEKDRKNPISIDSNSFEETAVFTLPQGFIVDETPDDVMLDTPFAKYKSGYQVKDGKLFYHRSMVLVRSLIPMEKYGAVREFFSKVLASEQSPVVLMRQ